MKKLLMATDLSGRSSKAFERALILARHHQAELHMVHIVDEALPESIAVLQKAAAEDNLQKQMDSLPAGEAPAIKAEIKIGKDSDAILRHAREVGAELIVLGVHDMAYESAFRGTTCERIIRMGHLPVLVVKGQAKAHYQRVAVAMDFSIHSRRAVEFALSLAPDADIHLIHAYQIPLGGFMYGKASRAQVEKEEQRRMEQTIEKEMATSIRALGADPRKLQLVLRHGDVRAAIRQEVDRLKPDLIALGTHGRTGIAHAFLGSVAEDVLGNPPCDALAVKAW